MSNHVARVLLFVIALPAIFALIVWDPGGVHLPFILVVLVVCGVSAHELSGILIRRGLPVNPVLSAILGALPSGLVYLETLTLVPVGFAQAALAVLYVGLFSYRIFSRSDEQIHAILPKLTGYLFLLVYPGYFATFVVRISAMPHATILLLTYILACYLNDSTAWAAGILWGRGTRNVVVVSPNKSIVGFAAGFLASILVVAVAAWVFPAAFPLPPPALVVIGGGVGLAAIAGDLVESAFKRSAIVKDSGALIPGRGGLLDSIDSPLFAAPIFYYLFILALELT